MAPPKCSCPAGETSLPGHAVPPEHAGWVSTNVRDIYCVPLAANHHLGNLNVYMSSAEKQEAILRLTLIYLQIKFIALSCIAVSILQI